jgi:DNA invertase Pin-like site-specific DNA recombinase
MKKPILCLECRRKRILLGLANARAKGKLIGRKKLRDSDLIRKLLKAGMTYRNIAIIAKCSHGSVHAEVVACKKETMLQKTKELEDQKLKDEMEKATIVFPEMSRPAPTPV